MDEIKFFEENYKLYRRKVYVIINHYTRDMPTIEDLVSQTFMQAWIHRADFRGESAYSTWLISIAIHATLNHLAHLKSRPTIKAYDFILDRHTDGTDTLHLASVRQELDMTIKAINALPSTMRDVMKLGILYGLNYEEIAEELKIPIGTVRSRYHNARRMLNAALIRC